jgi:outer membrane protein assembly factor BamB
MARLVQTRPLGELRGWARVAVATAVAAGVTAIIAIILLASAMRDGGPASVLDPPAITELKRDLRQDPVSAPVKARLRSMDAEVRSAFLRRQQLLDTGRWVLLGSILICLVAARLAARWSAPLPEPGRADTRGAAWLRRAWRVQEALLLAIVIAAAAGFYSVWRQGSPADRAVSPGATTPRPAATVVDVAEFRRQWPSFRGPCGDGVAVTTNVPSGWDGPSSNGVAWAVPVPLPGNSSPIVWNDRVFLTGADKDRREVYGFDRRSGRLLWRTGVTAVGDAGAPPEVMQDTGYAASTPATDGVRVYAMFANGDLAALDYDGRVVWTQALGPLVSMYGHASSLLTWKHLLIVQLDQGAEEDGLSRVVAFEGATGRTVWETARPVPNSWSSPAPGGPPWAPLLVTTANPWVIGYDPATGDERWRAECLSGDVAPTPVWRDGVVYAVNTGASLAAIRADGTGTVTETHIAWKAEDNLPDTCSPLCTGPRVYLLTSTGLLTCFDTAGGAKLWEHELGENCQASPTLAGGRIHVLTQSGAMIIVDDAAEYREVGRHELGEEGCAASPAFIDGAILLRSATRLWCIGR